MSKTEQELKKLPKKQLAYLTSLRNEMRRFYQESNLQVGNEYRHAARGYIQCLDDCGIASFRTLWAWFTLYEGMKNERISHRFAVATYKPHLAALQSQGI